MKKIVIAAVCIAAVAPLPSRAEDSPDLKAYLDEIRASGISENSRGQLQMVAGICAGATLLEYRRDEASGQYWPSYTSATCPKPNADPPEIEKWKKLRRSETAVLADKLKPFADADGSGFVTTVEGNDFRWLVEFGYLVEQVNREEGTSAAAISRASGNSPEDVAKKIKAYDALARRIYDAGVAELPTVVLTAD